MSFNIKPIWVFDGMHLNAKSATEYGRIEEKMRNRKKAEQFDKQGNHEEAKKYFGKSMVISSKMINLFIDILHKLDIELIISPYEADAQISYLCKSGIADFGVSEDSDIVVFGCPTLVSKLQPSGDCSVIRINELWDKTLNKKYSDNGISELQKLNHNTFITICTMAGWDYLPSMERMGLKTGIKNFSKHKTLINLKQFLQKHKKFKDRIPKNYFESVDKVRDLFLYQTVYDPYTYKCRPLNDIPPNVKVDQSFMGEFVEAEHTAMYVKGHLNKYTMEEREIYNPDITRIEQDLRNNDITLHTFYYLNKDYDFTKKFDTSNEEDEEEKMESKNQGNLSC